MKCVLKQKIKFFGVKPRFKISKVQLARGIRIEHEHTNDKRIARAIATAHLREFPNYYNKRTGLLAFEKSLRKKR